MNEGLREAICLSCRTRFAAFACNLDHLICSACNQRYPIIGNIIPILVADPLPYLAKLYLTYEGYLRQQDKELAEIQREAERGKGRLDVLAQMQTAIEHNCLYIKSVQRSLLEHISVPDITSAVVKKEVVPYATTWEYLQRDWCWLSEGEEELKLIEASVLDAINHFGCDTRSALILGGGTGRIAWDVGLRYERVYALDSSLTMAHHFYDLLENDIVFYEINRKNMYANSDAVRMLKATLGPFGSSSVKRGDNWLSYWVGDGLDVPLANQSMSAIVSVYFTDLVPMRLYIEEIKRLLKPGGVFVHFGPLDYHFADINDSLSAEDIKAVFRAHGFEIVSEDRIVMSHLSSSLSMYSRCYNNWTFSAINRNGTVQTKASAVSWTSVLSIVNDVSYQARGVISREGECVIEANLLLPSGETYEGAISVLDILRTIDGVRTNAEVCEVVSQKYNVSETTRQRMLEILDILCRNKILRVRD